MMARGLMSIAVVGLLAAALLLSFELGRKRAGFSLLEQRREQAAIEAERAEYAARLDELERELAIQTTSSRIDSEASAMVRADLADLEARLQSQEAELSFYRSIAAAGDADEGLQIRNVAIEQNPAGSITLRVLLVQSVGDSNPVAGRLEARLQGSEDGQAAAYTLAELGGETLSGAIEFEFRYFQALEAELTLPDGFAPAELELEVWPRDPQGETIVQRFPWSSFEG